MVLVVHPLGKLDEVVGEDRKTDDQRLTRFHAVDSCENVDGIRAEHGKHPHVRVVQNSCEGVGDDDVVVVMMRVEFGGGDGHEGDSYPS